METESRNKVSHFPEAEIERTLMIDHFKIIFVPGIYS